MARSRSKGRKPVKKQQGSMLWLLVIIGLALLMVLVVGIFMTPCRQQQPDVIVEEAFCSSCSSGNREVEDELSTYQFTPCKCFGPQGGAINAPRPFREGSCSDATAMTKKKMIETQVGCLRNSFDFGGDKNIKGVS